MSDELGEGNTITREDESSGDDTIETLGKIASRIRGGGAITMEEAMGIADIPLDMIEEAGAIAFDLMRDIRGTDAAICSITNSLSGNCSENCAFCSQSAHHGSSVPETDLQTPDEMVEAARVALSNGSHHLGLVTACKGLTDEQFESLLEGVRRVKEETGVSPHGSLGILTREQAFLLAAAGMTEYNHNLETSREHFSNICTTHDYDDRIRTNRYASEAGMKVCCGGIINLGETWADRVSLAFSVKQCEAVSIPINILNPVPGTPLQDMPVVTVEEVIRTVILFRFINPAASILIAGGREMNLKDRQVEVFRAGANGLITGDYLTTTGADPAEDRKVIESAGLTWPE